MRANSDIISFEQITKEDSEKVEELSELASRIVKEHYDPIIGPEQNDYMIEMFQSPQAIREQLEHGYQYYRVRRSDVGPIGFMAMYKRENEWYISKLYLDKQYRGRGYSKAMIRHASKLGREAGAEVLTLNVNKRNSSVEIYERLGFTRIRSEVNDIGHGYVMDDYVYSLPIE